MVKAKNKYGLTPFQEAYCHEYIVDKSGARAARRAGSRAKEPRRVAEDLMHNPLVLRRIEQLMAEQLARTDVTAGLVLTELKAIATSDLAAYFDEKGRLKPIHEIPIEARRALASIEVEQSNRGCVVVKIKLWNKPQSLELIGKHLKMFHDLGELRLTTEPKDLKTAPEVEAEIARLRALLANGGKQ